MYPKAKYHPTQPHRVVHSENEEKELGNEWFDSPNFTAPPVPAAEESTVSLEMPEPEQTAVEEISEEEEDSPDKPRRGRPPKHK